jgi:hypothetical protein
MIVFGVDADVMLSLCVQYQQARMQQYPMQQPQINYMQFGSMNPYFAGGAGYQPGMNPVSVPTTTRQSAVPAVSMGGGPAQHPQPRTRERKPLPIVDPSTMTAINIQQPEHNPETHVSCYIVVFLPH